jgi:hypothetical protein
MKRSTIFVLVLFALAAAAQAQLPNGFPAAVDKGFVLRPGGNPANPADRAYWHTGLSTSAGTPIWDDDFANIATPLAVQGVNMTYVFGQCFGGGMVQDIVQIPASVNPIARVNATSAAKWFQPAYYRVPPRVPAPPPPQANNSNTDWVDWYTEMSRPGRGGAGGPPTHFESAMNAWWNDPFGNSPNPLRTRGPDETGTEEAQFRETIPGLAALVGHTMNPNGRRYAMLYSGKPNAVDREQILTMYDVLVTGYGYNPADIFVLYGTGAAALGAATPPALAGRVWPATLNDYADQMVAIMGRVATDPNPGLNQFFFFSNDHGTAWNDLMSPDRSRYLDVPKTPDAYGGSQGLQAYGADTNWATLPYYVPTPGGAIVLGLAGLACGRRRRD